jgi:hypothetical protein
MCSPCPPFQRRRPGRAVCVVDRKRVVKVHTGSALLDPRVNRRSALCTPGGSAVNFSQAAFTLYNARSVLFPSSLCLHGAPFGPSSESSSVYRGRDFCPLFRIAPPHTAAHAHRDRHATRVRPRPRAASPPGPACCAYSTSAPTCRPPGGCEPCAEASAARRLPVTTPSPVPAASRSLPSKRARCQHGPHGPHGRVARTEPTQPISARPASGPAARSWHD